MLLVEFHSGFVWLEKGKVGACNQDFRSRGGGQGLHWDGGAAYQCGAHLTKSSSPANGSSVVVVPRLVNVGMPEQQATKAIKDSLHKTDQLEGEGRRTDDVASDTVSVEFDVVRRSAHRLEQQQEEEEEELVRWRKKGLSRARDAAG